MHTEETVSLSKLVHEFDARLRCYPWNDIFDVDSLSRKVRRAETR